MFDYQVSKNQIEYAQKMISEYNFGMRGYGDGNKDEQLTGIIGQTVLADLLGLKRPDGKDGFDNGVDFIINDKKVDIKTMTRSVPMKNHYVHNFIGYQKNYDVDFYIFASFNKTNKILTICGTASKSEFKEKADFFEKGELRYRDDGTSFSSKAPLYEIKQSDLTPVSTKLSLLKNIK